MSKGTMVVKVEHDGRQLIFEKAKYEKAPLVNVYEDIDGEKCEIYCYTDYSIEVDMEKFRKSAKDIVEYLKESGQL